MDGSFGRVNVQHCVSLQIKYISWTLSWRDIIQTDSCSESCETRRCTVCLCVSLCCSAVLLVEVYMSCWQHNVNVCQLDWGSAELAAISSPTLFSDSSYFLFPRVTMSSTSSAKSRLPLSTSAFISRCTRPRPRPLLPSHPMKEHCQHLGPKVPDKTNTRRFHFY